METFFTYLPNIKKISYTLGIDQVLTVGACVCERMYPLYDIYTSQIDITVRNYLRNAIDRVWQGLLDQDDQVRVSGEFQYELALPKVFRGDPSPWLAGTASDKSYQILDGGGSNIILCTVEAVNALFEIYISRKPETVEIIASQPLNLLDDLIYNFLDIEVHSQNDEVIHRHPLMLNELSRQMRDFTEVQKEFDQRVIEAMRVRATKEPLVDYDNM